MDHAHNQQSGIEAAATTIERNSTVSNARKRPRATRAGSTYARKRAVTACELCRSRKAKCDNQHPCGTCVSLGANCVFRNRDNDYSTFDNASLAILDRVNYAVQLLEQSGPSAYPLQAHASPAVASTHYSPNDARSNGVPQTPNTTSDLVKVYSQTVPTDEAAVDKLSVNTRCACTHVLEWPVFEGRIKPSSVNPALYSEETSGKPNVHPYPTQSHSRSGSHTARIDEGDVHILVERFLRNVHTKNPILERVELLHQARVVAEEGFQWDATSCLVLIACALGSISGPWNVAVPADMESSLEDGRSHALADAYYTAARKRLGLLETSHQATQCWFLLGVFEMYKMRPLNGWASFSRACNLLELRLYAQSQHGLDRTSRDERRLYWSCLKSEAELREEFDLPEPGLARIERPYVLPSPPESAPGIFESAAADITAWGAVDEQSWYYYLSDIAYRRITNRTIAALYNTSSEQWLKVSTQQLYHIAQELDAQVLQWWANLPGSPSPTCEPDIDELTYMLYLNYADLRERIWRPFLYIAAHNEQSASDVMVIAGASKCLEMSLGLLGNALLKHRHHGLWQTVRCMVSKALVILAAAKSGHVKLNNDWRLTVESFQNYLRYWEAEAPDVKAANDALSTILQDVAGS